MKTMILPKKLKKIPKKIEEKVFIEKKKIKQALLPAVEEKKVLFTIGCQRSGTTMMLKIFEKDLNTRVYGEFSRLSCWDPNKIRLNPLDQVKREFQKENPPLLVLKPLVETQNTEDLLSYFSESKALWMYRHFKDVAASNLVNFGQKNGISDIRPIVEGDRLNWRSEGVTEEVREVVSKYFSEDMNEYDAAALFWYARNSLFFDYNMRENPRIMMCRYDDLVQNPEETMAKVYNFIDFPFPGKKIVTEVNARSVGKGKEIKLNPEIEMHCQGLLNRLDEVYLSRILP